MSKAGMTIALTHGSNLPAFPDEETAMRELLRARDDDIDYLRDLAASSQRFEPTFSPDSLKDLELFYFDLVNEERFEADSEERRRLRSAVATYLGAVLVKHAGYHWVVQEFAFARGRYEIGVRRHLTSVMLSSGWDPASEPSNQKRQSLWRKYKKWST
jgi:hypothetical protein